MCISSIPPPYIRNAVFKKYIYLDWYEYYILDSKSMNNVPSSDENKRKIQWKIWLTLLVNFLILYNFSKFRRQYHNRKECESFLHKKVIFMFKWFKWFKLHHTASLFNSLWNQVQSSAQKIVTGQIGALWNTRSYNLLPSFKTILGDLMLAIQQIRAKKTWLTFHKNDKPEVLSRN